jgi:Ca-activated chloride channel family protein
MARSAGAVDRPWPNHYPAGSTQGLEAAGRVREEADKQITLLGVGVDNDSGDLLMEQLADHGDGMVVYVSQPDQAGKVFVNLLRANLAVGRWTRSCR